MKITFGYCPKCGESDPTCNWFDSFCSQKEYNTYSYFEHFHVQCWRCQYKEIIKFDYNLLKIPDFSNQYKFLTETFGESE